MRKQRKKEEKKETQTKNGTYGKMKRRRRTIKM